jgi:hypothetical protein
MPSIPAHSIHSLYFNLLFSSFSLPFLRVAPLTSIGAPSSSPSSSGSGITTKPGLGSAKTALAAPPLLVVPSSPLAPLSGMAPAPAPAHLESREKRREKMMTLSRKFGTSRLAVSSLGIAGDFAGDDKAENAVRIYSFIND